MSNSISYDAKVTLLLPLVHALGGKVIGHVVVIVSTKIALSWDLGTWATHKHLESVELGETLASVSFKSRDTIHERQIVPFC